jgi:2-(1,2-epoxy-1,2-dihydrophenyl)acetyl-CoA isomerase
MIETRRFLNALDVRREGDVLHIVMNAPAVRNALTQVQMLRLGELLEQAAADDTIRVVALTGAKGHFCAGGAIASFGDASADETNLSNDEKRERRIERLEQCAGIARSLRTMPKPTVALIQGAAAGAGMIYALACDIRIASETAIFTTAFARLALSGDMGAAALLMRLAGPAQARELLLMSSRLSAADALRRGLLTEVVPESEFERRTSAVLLELSWGPPLAYAAIKENLAAAEERPYAEAIAIEARNMVSTLESLDHIEARRTRALRLIPDFVGY